MNTTIKDIRDAGHERGYNIASWVDLPDLGTEVKAFEVEQFIGTIESIDDASEVFSSMSYANESSGRDFSPFEFTANDIDKREDSEEACEAFDEGITEGIAKNWEERRNYYEA